MPSLTLTNLLVAARDYAQDNDATTGNYAFADAAVTRLINRFYSQHKLATENRQQLLTATTSGLSFADTDTFKLTTPTNIRRFVNAWSVVGASSATPDKDTQPLEHVSENEMLEWMSDFQYHDLGGGAVVTARWSAVRIQTPTAASVGKWRFRIHPFPNVATYILTEVELEPTALSAGSDIPDVLDDEGYGLAALTGAWMAARMGRGWLVNGILAEVPPSMQALAKSVREQLLPDQPAEEYRK